jgi:hypothetical protein
VKLISVKNARAIWLSNLNDLNPRGRAIERDVLSELARRYSFARIPDIREVVEARKKNQPIVLESGTFLAQSGDAISIELSVYNDGLIVDSRCSTRECERFLEEVFSWLHVECGLVDFRTIAIKKLYVSELHLSSENSLNIINPAMDRFAEILAGKIASPIKNVKYEVGALGFWIDPAQNPRHVHFRLERQEDARFEEKRYYSIAPLQTDEHLDALAVLENLLSPKATRIRNAKKRP